MTQENGGRLVSKYTLDRKLILPGTIDNAYQGNAIAKYLFYIIVVFTMVRSIIHIFSADGGAQSIATIPLNSFSPDNAANTVVFLFALWGLSQLIMGGFYAIVAIRYKSLIPLMYAFIALEYTMRILLGHMKPISISGVAPGEIGNYILVPVSLILFIVSIMRRKSAEKKV
jgi:hypothetical protein